MAGTTNTLQWNPTQANQENDAAYLADPQRAGGASNPSEFDAELANKLFYQLSTYVTALGQMLANKNFTNSDANLATLTAVMANILTTADLPGSLQTVTWAASIALNTVGYTGFQITLGGNTTFTAPSTTPGQFVLLVLVQDGTGGRTVTLGSGFSYTALNPSPTAGIVSAQLFFASAAGALEAIGPLMTTSGIDGTPVGAVVPSTGAFSALTAPTVASSDNSTKAATTAWAKFGLSVNIAATGHIKLPSWLGGLVINWGTVGPGNGATANFDLSFPSTLFGVFLTAIYNSGSDANTRYVQVNTGATTAGFELIVSNSASATECYYFALGN